MKYIPAAAAAIVATVLSVAAEQPEPQIARAVQMFASLEKTLLDRPDIRPLLQDSRAMLTHLLRNAPRLAKAWQMQPSFVEALSDDELFAFVTERANAVMICGLELMARVPLESFTRGSAEALDVRRTYAPGAADGGLRLSPDCATIETAEREPAKLRTRAEFQAIEPSMLRPFADEAQLAFGKRAIDRGATFGQNQQYLDRLVGAPQAEPELTAVARRLDGGATIVSGRVLNLLALAAVRGDTARVVLFIPISQ